VYRHTNTNETLSIPKNALFERVEFNQVMSRFREHKPAFRRFANATNSCSEVCLSTRSLNGVCFWLGAC